jgi:hypothetical protein
MIADGNLFAGAAATPLPDRPEALSLSNGLRFAG